MIKTPIFFVGGVVLLHCFLIVDAVNAQSDTGARANVDINLGESDFRCPEGYPIYPHPQCNMYYTCYGGQPTYLWQCKLDYLFDLTYNGCNWPEQTYCGNRTRPDGSSPAAPMTTQQWSTPESSETPKPLACPEDGFFAAYPDRCSKTFYTCLDGSAYPTNCPAYGVFEPVARKCINPNSPACNTGTTSSVQVSTTKSAFQTTMIPTLPSSTSEPKTTIIPTLPPSSSVPETSKTTPGGAFVCPSNGSYPDPNSCSHYYTCDNGVAYHFSCPGGLVFNPLTGVCDWPSSVPSCNNSG